jgi:hypothetical protein
VGDPFPRLQEKSRLILHNYLLGRDPNNIPTALQAQFKGRQLRFVWSGRRHKPARNLKHGLETANSAR